MSDKKPWEEEWQVHPLDFRAVASFRTGLVVCDVRAPPAVNGREVSALISAAPVMARALLAVAGRDCNKRLCWCSTYGGPHLDTCDAALDALQKEGAL